MARLVYRSGSARDDNLTPRPGKDTEGKPGQAPAFQHSRLWSKLFSLGESPESLTSICWEAHCTAIPMSLDSRVPWKATSRSLPPAPMGASTTNSWQNGPGPETSNIPIG